MHCCAEPSQANWRYLSSQWAGLAMAQTVRMISINLSLPLKAWLPHITPNSSPTFQNFDKNPGARRHTLPFVQLRTPVDYHRETSSASWVKHSFRIATGFTGLVSQLQTR